MSARLSIRLPFLISLPSLFDINQLETSLRSAFKISDIMVCEHSYNEDTGNYLAVAWIGEYPRTKKLAKMVEKFTN